MRWTKQMLTIMPQPSKQQRQVHRQFLRREKMYESKFYRVFFAILARQYREAGKIYPEPYIVNPNDYRSAIMNVYQTCVPSEAEITWQYYVTPLTSDRKDFFDDLAALLGFDIPDGEHIRLWRRLTNEWLEVNILTKIQGIAQTTQRAIAKVIQQGLDEGLSEYEIGKYIREQSKGEINQYRARMIGRTEVVMSLNQGRHMAMVASNLEWTHKWVDTLDERTRTSHRIVSNGKPIPLLEPYTVPIIKDKGIIGTEPARYPGDPTLSAGNVINCRCTEVFEVVRDAAGRPKRKVITPRPISMGQLVEAI